MVYSDFTHDQWRVSRWHPLFIDCYYTDCPVRHDDILVVLRQHRDEANALAELDQTIGIRFEDIDSTIELLKKIKERYRGDYERSRQQHSTDTECSIQTTDEHSEHADSLQRTTSSAGDRSIEGSRGRTRAEKRRAKRTAK